MKGDKAVEVAKEAPLFGPVPLMLGSTTDTEEYSSSEIFNKPSILAPDDTIFRS